MVPHRLIPASLHQGLPWTSRWSPTSLAAKSISGKTGILLLLLLLLLHPLLLPNVVSRSQGRGNSLREDQRSLRFLLLFLLLHLSHLCASQGRTREDFPQEGQEFHGSTTLAHSKRIFKSIQSSPLDESFYFVTRVNCLGGIVWGYSHALIGYLLL